MYKTTLSIWLEGIYNYFTIYNDFPPALQGRAVQRSFIYD